MPTANGLDQALDQQTTASASTDDFGINVGEKILEQASLAEITGEHASRCNIGSLEQKIRIGSGVALLAAAGFAPLSRGWRIGLAVAGLSQLVTGATRYCPVWQAMGIDTRKDAPLV